MKEVAFPNEIWLEIFKRIDMLKLMELRLVCKQFYDLIEYLLNKSPEWKNLSYDIIMHAFLKLTMQRAFPYVLVSHWKHIDDPVLWRETYLSFKKWQKVMVKTHSKNTIARTSNFGDISCIRTFDKYITIASNNGSIANYTVDNISQAFYVANHGTSIKQIEFWYSNGEVLVATIGDDNALQFWDLKRKIEIPTDGFFANSINSGECRHFCIGNVGGILTSYERVGKRISPGTILNFKLKYNQHLIGHFVDGVYMSILIWDDGVRIPRLYDIDIEGEKLIKFKMYPPLDVGYFSESLVTSFRKFIMPTTLFFFGIGENRFGSIDFCRKKWLEYNLGRHFGCNVSSLALHAHILMLGLEDGSIHLLNIIHYGYVIELEVGIKDSKKIEVDTEPIVDLTVLEVNKKPCIVAATSRKVHVINFF